MHIMYESTRAFDVCYRTVCIRSNAKAKTIMKKVDNLLTLQNKNSKLTKIKTIRQILDINNIVQFVLNHANRLLQCIFVSKSISYKHR